MKNITENAIFKLQMPYLNSLLFCRPFIIMKQNDFLTPLQPHVHPTIMCPKFGVGTISARSSSSSCGCASTADVDSAHTMLGWSMPAGRRCADGTGTS